MVSLHKKFAAKGLKILGFPCNQFGNQEPGSAEEIKSFVKARNVDFTLTEKVDVNGPNTCDTYRFLKVLA
jgi:glutathione peroxidase-family protein